MVTSTLILVMKVEPAVPVFGTSLMSLEIRFMHEVDVTDSASMLAVQMIEVVLQVLEQRAWSMNFELHSTNATRQRSIGFHRPHLAFVILQATLEISGPWLGKLLVEGEEAIAVA